MTATEQGTSNNKGLYFYSLFLAAATYFLLIAGGLVTSHEAGLAVPDWPLSYGQWMPPMVGNIFWEHGHRMIAGTVGILTLILAILLQIKDPRVWMKKLGWVAVAAVVLQAVLGGVTVLLMLPPAVSIFHACLGQTFFCIVISLAYFQSSYFKNRTLSVSQKSIRLFTITTIMVFIQLILGAVTRHTELSAVPHILLGVIIFVHAALVARHGTMHYSNDGVIQKPALFFGLFTVIQFFLGMGAFVTTRMLERGHAPTQQEVIFTASHQALGAALLGLIFFLALVVRSRAKQS